MCLVVEIERSAEGHNAKDEHERVLANLEPKKLYHIAVKSCIEIIKNSIIIY